MGANVVSQATGDSPPPGGTGRIYPAVTAQASSWGGGVLFHNGQYHLYVSEMARHCGLATWGTNSFIRHAVSDTVDGIYAPLETVMGAWSHNALPWVAPDGTITVWHIGNDTHLRPHGPEHTGCANGTTPVHTPPGTALSPGSGLAGSGQPQRALVAASRPILVSEVPYSSSPSGPWKRMPITCATPSGTPPTGPCPIDNPTPVSFPNGTTLLAHRARNGFGVLVAPHWSGPYRNVANGQ
jgi:hypothetical protein